MCVCLCGGGGGGGGGSRVLVTDLRRYSGNLSENLSDYHILSAQT